MNQRKLGVLLSYGQIFAYSIIGILYTPLLLRYLGQSEYGIYSLCASMIAYLQLFNLGFASAYVRYYSRFKAAGQEMRIEQLNGMYLMIFSGISGAILFCGLSMSYYSGDFLGNRFTIEEVELAKILMGLMTFNLALTMPLGLFISFITARERFIFQKSIAIFTVLLNPLISLFFLSLGYRSVAVVLVTTVLSLLSFCCHIAFCIRTLKMRFQWKAFDVALLKEISVFSVFIFLQVVMDKFNWEINKFIIGMYCGSAAVAIYAVGAQINQFFIMFSTSISNVFVPQINRLVAEPNSEDAISALCIRVARIQFMVVFYIFTSFLFLGKGFVFIWAGDLYTESYFVALLLMAPIVLPLTQTLSIEIVRAKNLHAFLNSIFVGISIANVYLSTILTQRSGAVGSALGTCLTMAVAQNVVAFLYYHFRAKIDMKLYIKEISKLLPAGFIPCLFGGLMAYIWQEYRLDIFLYLGTGYTVLYVLCYWNWGMNAYERELCRQIAGKFLKK